MSHGNPFHESWKGCVKSISFSWVMEIDLTQVMGKRGKNRWETYIYICIYNRYIRSRKCCSDSVNTAHVFMCVYTWIHALCSLKVEYNDWRASRNMLHAKNKYICIYTYVSTIDVSVAENAAVILRTQRMYSCVYTTFIFCMKRISGSASIIVYNTFSRFDIVHLYSTFHFIICLYSTFHFVICFQHIYTAHFISSYSSSTLCHLYSTFHFVICFQHIVSFQYSTLNRTFSHMYSANWVCLYGTFIQHIYTVFIWINLFTCIQRIFSLYKAYLCEQVIHYIQHI